MAEINTDVKIPRRILNTLLTSLAAGVVPRIGAPYIAIGREDEIGTLLDNLDDVKEGGAACRFLIGRYGSGKSFLIQLIRGRALERGFICADADLSPERRLTGGNGAGLATYRELMTNMASKAAPDGGALPTVLSRHYTLLRTELVGEGFEPETKEFEAELIRLMNEAEGEGSDPIIIALIDSDNFFRVNNDFGREYGDKVLIDTGRYLESKLPAGATIYRVSGDEFGIIFNNEMEKEDREKVIEMIKKKFEKQQNSTYIKLWLQNISHPIIP